MPYKNPEDKRRWEREHREQRNAKRRRRHLGAQMEPIVPKSAPDPIPDQESTNGWKVIIGLAVGFGVVLLAALGGMFVPGTDSRGPSPNPGG